jgi:hypothetical protein
LVEWQFHDDTTSLSPRAAREKVSRSASVR